MQKKETPEEEGVIYVYPTEFMWDCVMQDVMGGYHNKLFRHLHVFYSHCKKVIIIH